jgi:hypothetical protein
MPGTPYFGFSHPITRSRLACSLVMPHRYALSCCRLSFSLSGGFLLRNISSILVSASYTLMHFLHYILFMYYCPFSLALAMKPAYTFPVSVSRTLPRA